jgi:hypothetical protein
MTLSLWSRTVVLGVGACLAACAEAGGSAAERPSAVEGAEPAAPLTVASTGRTYQTVENELLWFDVNGVELGRATLAQPIAPPWPDAEPARFEVTDLTVDPQGNVVVAGALRWYALPGVAPSLDELGPGFVAKYTADGEPIWAKQIRRARPRGLASDGTGRVFLASVFYDGGVSVDGTRIRHESGMFFALLDADGGLVWLRDTGPTTALTLEASTDPQGQFVAAGTTAEAFQIAGRDVVPAPEAPLPFVLTWSPTGDLLP